MGTLIFTLNISKVISLMLYKFNKIDVWLHNSITNFKLLN